MKTKCLIVDDEPLARDLIRSYTEKLENFDVVAECGDAIKALEILREKQVDLIFLDIQMPQITGIEFLKTLKYPPGIILMSAFSKYALDGFELDVVDYLLKPITFERFLKSVNKFYQLGTDDTQVITSTSSGYFNHGPYIYVRENKKMVKILLNEILYIEGLSEYVRIHTKGKRIVTKSSMAGMEQKLPEDGFLRIHKSFIVSLDKIEAFSATSIEVPGKGLPIGRSYKNNVWGSLRVNGMVS